MQRCAGQLSALGFLSLTAAICDAAEFTGHGALTTDYVRRGVTQSDGHGAVQVGIDVTGKSGWYAGAWVSTVDIEPAPGRERDIETNYYAGYLFDATDRLSLGANVVVYEYPGATGPIDYGYVEYSLTSNYDDWLFIEYAYSPDLYNTGADTHNLDAFIEIQVAEDLLVGAGGGYYDVSDFSGRGYGYWQLGLTKMFRRTSLDLRFHDSNRWVLAVSDPERAESRLSLTFSVSF